MISRNIYWRIAALGLMLSSFGALIGCDWTTGGESINSSSEANVNFSGFYRGNLSGGRAVSPATGGIISSLVIQQIGETIEVRDSNGSVYMGRIFGVTSAAGAGDVAAAGSTLVHAQVVWEGQDNIAAKNIQFAGTIRVVTVEDIVSSSSSNDSESTTETTDESEDSSEFTSEIGVDLGIGTNTTSTSSTTLNSESTTSTQTSTSSSGKEFSLTDANSQYRLQGTWVEVGGKNAQVDALAAGNAGTVTSTD